MTWNQIVESFIKTQKGKLEHHCGHWQDSVGNPLSKVEVNAMLVAAGCHPKVAARTRKFLEPDFAQPAPHPIPDAVIEQLAGRIVYNRTTKWWLSVADGSHLFDREVNKLLREATGAPRTQDLRRQMETYFVFSTQGERHEQPSA